MGRMRCFFGWGLILVALLLLCPESYAATAKEDSLSRLQQPTVRKKTHLYGNLWLTVSNYGFFGSEHDQTSYSCVFPAGSDMEYLFWGGLWLGALVGNDTLVSCGCEGWAGPHNQFYPTDDPGDTIVERSISPQSPYYDTAAVSEQDFVCAYSDTYTDPSLVGEGHIPLGLKIYQNSYVFTHPVAEDFIFFDFRIANIGTQFIRDLYMGLYLDGDCRPFGAQYGNCGAQDDVTGFRPWAVLTADTSWNPKLRVSTAWIANACLIGLMGECVGTVTPDVTGTRVLMAPNPQLQLSYNWWFSDQGVTHDWGPWNPSNPKDSLLQLYAWEREQQPEPGTPVSDAEKWLMMSNSEFDPDQTVGVVQGPHADTVYDDTRYVLSFGPIFTAPDSTFPPGDSVRLILAYTGGEGFQIYDYPPDPGTPSEDWYDFTDIALNAQWSVDIYDNPGVDTDTSDTLYPWYVIEPFTGDTIWMGDGVPDFRVPLELPPGPPKEFRITAWNDSSVTLAWWMSLEADLKGYNVYRSVTTGTLYTKLNTSLITDTTFTDTTAQIGNWYYYVGTCVDSLDLESEHSDEVSIFIGPPHPPTNLTASSGDNGYVDLNWGPSQDMDLLGYNLYRSETSGSLYVKIDSLFPDTCYRDTNLTNGVIYYYVVSAVDSTYFESEYSNEARAVPMGFDSGILLVDETWNGTRAQGLPTDEQVDSLYHRIVEGYRYTDWDNSDGSNPPTLVDLAPYTTILWHSDDPSNSNFLSSAPALTTYLFVGGRLFLVGWRVMRDWGPYEEGDFAYDYLHLLDGQMQTEMDFIGAEGLLGYPTLQVDSNRALPPFHGQLAWIGVYTPRDAEIIYTFNSASGDTFFQGHPCGVRYLGADHRVVFFGFPLWPMGEDAVLAGREALDDLGELVGVEESVFKPVPRMFSLSQNYPNPCSGSTVIRYCVASAVGGQRTAVSLRVYDLSGRLAKTVVDGPQKPGYYSVVWDGKDSSGNNVSAGVYFYRLTVYPEQRREAGDFTATKKLVVLR